MLLFANLRAQEKSFSVLAIFIWWKLTRIYYRVDHEETSDAQIVEVSPFANLVKHRKIMTCNGLRAPRDLPNSHFAVAPS